MTFAATEELMVCELIHHPPFLEFLLEALREIQYSDTPNQDINLLKDVAIQAYLG